MISDCGAPGSEKPSRAPRLDSGVSSSPPELPQVLNVGVMLDGDLGGRGEDLATGL